MEQCSSKSFSHNVRSHCSSLESNYKTKYSCEHWRSKSTLFHIIRYKREKILFMKKIYFQDSQICLWSINGKFLNKIQAHNGSPIWCLDISTDDRRMITGAADGSVYVWPFPFINEEKKNCTLGSEINKTPKFTCFLSDGTILVVRDDGEINFFNSITHCLTKSFSVSNLSSYLVIQLSPDRKRICFASKDGFISIYEINNEQELTHQINEKIMDSKIFSMQWLSNESLLLCGSLGRLIIVDVKSDGENFIFFKVCN